ncbi:MAG: peptidylprolyl isomerase [Clostridiaceae bacterium]
MKKSKMLISAAIAGVMSLSIAGCGLIEKTPEAKQKTVLATVDKDKITKGDLEVFELRAYGTEHIKSSEEDDSLSDEEMKKSFLAYAEGILDMAVDDRVMLKKSQDLGLEATDEDVESYIEETKAEFDSEEKYQETLTALGFNNETIKDYFKEYLSKIALLDDMYKDLEVTDEEAKAYYDENKESFTKAPGANISHILVKDEATAKEIKEKLDNGGDFAALAKEFSADPGSAQYGGELGYYPYENSGLVTEFIEAAKKLGENEISEPVKSEHGYHIIKTTDIVKEATVTPLEEVSARIKESILKEKQNAIYTENLEKWRDEYNVKTYPEKIEKLISK